MFANIDHIRVNNVTKGDRKSWHDSKALIRIASGTTKFRFGKLLNYIELSREFNRNDRSVMVRTNTSRMKKERHKRKSKYAHVEGRSEREKLMRG